jgi:hypothetical protein
MNNRSESLIKSWKNRPNYIGDIKHPKLYNIWRSFMFTKKGQEIGCSEEWKDYRTFYNDIKDLYSEGLRLIRKDKNLNFNKDNCVFVSDIESANLKGNNILLTYKEETKTLLEWSIDLNISLKGLRIRYHRYKDILPIDQILFGRIKTKKRNITDYKLLEYQQQKNKISKMLSSYKVKDNNKRLEFDLDYDFMINNIVSKNCIYCNNNLNIGCDRIDNNIGHIKTNVVPCCYICNIVRSNNFTIEEMKLLGKVIEEIRINKSNPILKETFDKGEEIIIEIV